MNERITTFLNKLKPDAQTLETETTIPWFFAFTQAGHESRWGESGLSAVHNNLFGFTANEAWLKAGKPTTRMLTRECSPKPPEQIRYWEFEGDIFSKEKTAAGGSELKVWRYFRKYDTWLDSLRDWANLLAKPRFARALAGAKAGNFTEFALGLQEAGYATDTDPVTKELVYARKLTTLYDDIKGLSAEGGYQC